MTLHPVCQEELYDPGRDVPINPNENSILTPQRPVPDVRLGYASTGQSKEAGGKGCFPYLGDAATAKHEALAWHSSQRVEQLHREPPVPSCQKVLLLDGVFSGEAYVLNTPSVSTVS